MISLKDLPETASQLVSQDHLLPQPSMDAAWNTLIALKNAIPSPYLENIEVIPAILTLVSRRSESTKASSNQTPGTRTREYLAELVRAAHIAANSHACSSVLAGHNSESDDYGDIGICLPSTFVCAENDSNTTVKSLLSELGLGSLLDTEGAQAVPVFLSENNMSPTFNASPGDTSVMHLAKLLDELDNRIAFRLDCARGESGKSFYFLTGRPRDCQDKSEDCWIGILGVGIWSG